VSPFEHAGAPAVAVLESVRIRFTRIQIEHVVVTLKRSYGLVGPR